MRFSACGREDLHALVGQSMYVVVEGQLFGGQVWRIRRAALIDRNLLRMTTMLIVEDLETHNAMYIEVIRTARYVNSFIRSAPLQSALS